MPFKLHQSYLDKYVPSTRGAGLAKHEGGKKSMTQRTEKLVSATTSAATAFGLGFLEGKDMMPVIGKGADGKGGVSVEVLGSAAILGLEFFGMTGKGRVSSVLHDAAVGGLAYWAGVMGTIVAGRTSPGGGYIKGNAVRGAAPAQMNQGGRTMTPEELWKAQFR